MLGALSSHGVMSNSVLEFVGLAGDLVGDFCGSIPLFNVAPVMTLAEVIQNSRR